MPFAAIRGGLDFYCRFLLSLEGADRLQWGILRLRRTDLAEDDHRLHHGVRVAHVFIGLINSDYLASHYCWKVEYRRAMNRRARGTMRVVAVVVRPCD